MSFFKSSLFGLVLGHATLLAGMVIMPFDGDVYVTPLGGCAWGWSDFGVGTSESNFVPYITGLPYFATPNSEVFVGSYTQGTTVPFAIKTILFFFSGFAFATGNDAASVVAFTDTDNSLGLGGSIAEQTGPSTWLLHLDDAWSMNVDDDDNDILMQVRLAPIPEPSSMELLLLGGLALAGISWRHRGA